MSNYSNNRLDDNANSPWYKIRALVPEGSRVLDVGCSSGNLGAALIKEKNCEVIGIDLNEADVTTAKKQLTGAYVRNIEEDDLSFLGKFDCIIFADVIEHLVDPVQALEEVKKKILKKSGAVIFSIPNMAHISTRMMLMEGRFTYGETGLLDKTHLHYYDRYEVERVFNDAGYALQVFDWVERYIPDKVLANQLSSIGLVGSKEFYEFSKRVESIAYEFVGKATENTKPAQGRTLPFVSPNIPEIDQQIVNIEAIYKQDLIRQTAKLENEIDALQHKEARLISSTSWKITLPLRLANGVLWRVRQKSRIIIYQAARHPLLRPTKYAQLNRAAKQYRQNDNFLLSIKRAAEVKTAVVVHLYYTDSWPLLLSRVRNIEKQVPLDLFITLPTDKFVFSEKIYNDYPGAHVLKAPNRGRDVLPFIMTASKLEALGYEFVLKLHSKKSPHRVDGQEWFDQILTNLLPDKPDLLKSLLSILKNKNTGIIGPQGQYISLLVNYDANSLFLFKALERIFSKTTARKLYDSRSDYGFFAGTMFWARLDALRPILKQRYRVYDFEHERGRIDGTLAHALERVFCLVPEIEKRLIYEIGPTSTVRLTYLTYNIPEWSDVHPKNKKRAPKPVLSA